MLAQRQRIFRSLPGLILLCALSACGPDKPRAFGPPAFYYWQTVFRLSPGQQHRLDSLRCQRLYVKVLDLGISPENGQPVPLALLETADSSGLEGRVIIPCVFITNEVFQRTGTSLLPGLAEKVVGVTGTQAPEIQIDCDWTATTREPYFVFLREIKKRLPAACRLSATIRLHQYRFPRQTGVPPVDRGMLMLYNTGDIDDPKTRNSIFDPADARKYIEGASAGYPLPLDVALPDFSWALVFRQGEFWKILPDFDARQLRDTSYFQAAGTDRWEVRRGTFRGGLYLRPGDHLRYESITPALLDEAQKLAAQIDLADDATLAYFHL
ncbi:MAG TPA: hypothetical protein PKH43_06640 [Saprospiraceae bacterium]|nr:hypothetical protein [Saprospiraceae bacterium]